MPLDLRFPPLAFEPTGVLIMWLLPVELLQIMSAGSNFRSNVPKGMQGDTNQEPHGQT